VEQGSEGVESPGGVKYSLIESKNTNKKYEQLKDARKIIIKNIINQIYNKKIHKFINIKNYYKKQINILYYKILLILNNK